MTGLACLCSNHTASLDTCHLLKPSSAVFKMAVAAIPPDTPIKQLDTLKSLLNTQRQLVAKMQGVIDNTQHEVEQLKKEEKKLRKQQAAKPVEDPMTALKREHSNTVMRLVSEQDTSLKLIADRDEEIKRLRKRVEALKQEAGQSAGPSEGFSRAAASEEQAEIPDNDSEVGVRRIVASVRAELTERRPGMRHRQTLLASRLAKRLLRLLNLILEPTRDEKKIKRMKKCAKKLAQWENVKPGQYLERAYYGSVKDGLKVDITVRHGLCRTGTLQLFISQHDFLLEIMPVSDVAAVCLYDKSQTAAPSALPGTQQADWHVKDAAAPPATINDEKSNTACPKAHRSFSSISGTAVVTPTISSEPSELPKADLPDSTAPLAPLAPPQDDLAQSENLDDSWLAVTAGRDRSPTLAMRKDHSSEAVSSQASGREGLQDRGDL